MKMHHFFIEYAFSESMKCHFNITNLNVILINYVIKSIIARKSPTHRQLAPQRPQIHHHGILGAAKCLAINSSHAAEIARRRLFPRRRTAPEPALVGPAF